MSNRTGNGETCHNLFPLTSASSPARPGTLASAQLVQPHDLVPQPGPEPRSPSTEHEAPLEEPQDRALLPEPPERPVTGLRRAPVFRGRRPAGDNRHGRAGLRCRPGARAGPSSAT